MAEYDLPEEVMTEILSRLPANSLCKFKCVSKFVLNLTLDSNFVKLHLTRAIERDNREIIVKHAKHSSHDGEDGKEINLEELNDLPNFGVAFLTRTFISCVDVQVGSLEKSHEIDISFGDYWSTCVVLGSCNGIVCVANKYQISLLNPCTREFKIIKGNIDNIEYGGDPVYGFGYDNSQDIYKLVQVVKSENNESEIRVYSLCDDDISCSKVSSVPYQVNAENYFGVFLNGVFHWVGNNKFEYGERIISFDAGSKLVLEIPRPDHNDSLFERLTFRMFDPAVILGIVEGNLALFRSDYVNVVIWVMQAYGVADSWCELLSITQNSPYPWPSFFDDPGLRLLLFTKNAEVLINKGKTVVMCDLKRRTAQELDIGAILNKYQKNRIVVHVPSLSLKSGKFLGTDIRDEEKEMTKGLQFSFSFTKLASWVW